MSKRAIVLNGTTVTGFWLAPDSYSGPEDAAKAIDRLADEYGVHFWRYVNGAVERIPDAERQPLIDAVIASRASSTATAMEREEILRKLLLVIFNHENRLRDIEVKPRVTLEQVKTFIRGL